MNKDITQNHLLLYAYNELDGKESAQVELAMAANSDLADQYTELCEMLLLMDSYQLSPNPTSLQIILEESSSALELH